MEYNSNSSGHSNPAATFGRSSQYNDDQLEKAKRQVEDVKGIMGQNVQRIIARGETLENLDDRASQLTANASEFQRTSRTLKKKMWWKNLKMMLILGVVVVIIIIVIILATVGVHGGGGSGPPPSVVPTTKPPGVAGHSDSDGVIASRSRRSVLGGGGGSADAEYGNPLLADPGA